MNKIVKLILAASSVFLLALFSSSCEKYLDAKSNIKLTIPSTLMDLQGLMDAYNVMSQTAGQSAEASSDNIYLTEDSYNAIVDDGNKRLYIWEKDNFFPVSSAGEWGVNYRAIKQANSVLMNLEQIGIDDVDQSNRNNIRGQALCFRGLFFLRTTCLFAKAYNEATSTTDLGISLKLNDDFNEKTTRASVEESYRRVIADLKAAIPLLPNKQIALYRPSKPTAYGLLARTYLYMRKYKEAGLYADSCLQIYKTLINYNTLKATDALPIKQFNDEVIFGSRLLNGYITDQTVAKINPELYVQYEASDLRKTIFFVKNTDGSQAFKGFYEGAPTPFGGVATDELYLIRAESAARAGNTAAALADLNTLLQNRYTAPFKAITAATPEEALARILVERRKELLLRDIRWMDIKRLNLEGANITQTRTLGTKVYTLKPNDMRYALPIPEDVIALSGIPQNPR